MSEISANILIVEDSMPLALMYEEFLSESFEHIYQADNAQKAYFYLDNKDIDLVFLDFRLPDEDGDVVLKWMNQHHPHTAVVIVTAHGSVDIAVEMIRIGADDFLQKPIDQSRLLTTAKNIVEKQQLKTQLQAIESTYHKHNYHDFIGSSEPMQKVYRMIDAVANSQASVFITGESGTGKEVCANAIHLQSDRKDKPFVALNCSAIPKDLIESEIFGHMKGAFTGAVNERDGAAQQADGGTLFLDEIGEMDLNLQSKLLRFIQTGIVKKLGGTKEEKVDVRFVCATNRDPLKEIAQARFREDLYYRLNVVPIHLVPLRERGKDVLELADFFLNDFTKNEHKDTMGLSDEAKQLLLDYDWPGNIRQLQNIIHNTVVFNDKPLIGINDLPSPLDTFYQQQPAKVCHQILQDNINEHLACQPMDEQKTVNLSSEVQLSEVKKEPHLNYIYYDEAGRPLLRSLSDIEREIIESALEIYDQNIPKVATYLEVSPSTIYRKKQSWESMKKH